MSNYIDKIKKNGVVYDIKGKGDSGGGGTAGSASGIIEFNPVGEEQTYQILEGYYTKPIVTAIKDGDVLYPLSAERYPGGSEAWETGDNWCYSLFIGMPEATSENSANVELFVLCFYRLLCRVQTSISIEVDAETGDTLIVVGEVQILGLDDEILADLHNTIESELITPWNLYGGAIGVGDGPEAFDLDTLASYVREFLEAVDSEVIKKWIGEPQVITEMSEI